jgi:hypothetical protein
LRVSVTGEPTSSPARVDRTQGPSFPFAIRRRDGTFRTVILFPETGDPPIAELVLSLSDFETSTNEWYVTRSLTDPPVHRPPRIELRVQFDGDSVPRRPRPPPDFSGESAADLDIQKGGWHFSAPPLAPDQKAGDEGSASTQRKCNAPPRLRRRKTKSLRTKAPKLERVEPERGPTGPPIQDCISVVVIEAI